MSERPCISHLRWASCQLFSLAHDGCWLRSLFTDTILQPGVGGSALNLIFTPFLAERPFRCTLKLKQRKHSTRPHTPPRGRAGQTYGMIFDPRTIFAIFSTAAALWGRCAAAASNGAPISPVSPTSSVPGHAFDRFVIITLENTVSLV